MEQGLGNVAEGTTNLMIGHGIINLFNAIPIQFSRSTYLLFSWQDPLAYHICTHTPLKLPICSEMSSYCLLPSFLITEVLKSAYAYLNKFWGLISLQRA